MKIERALITGGAGFLGQHLIYRLLQQTGLKEIRVLDLKAPEMPVFGSLLTDPRLHYQMDVNICDAASLAGHFENIDTVFHLAGLVSFSRLHRELLYAVNTEGARNVMQAAADAKVKQVLHISSVAAIGYHPQDLVIDENYAFDWPQAEADNFKHYMLSKKKAEDILVQMHQDFPETRWLMANPALMLGPGDLNNTYKLIQGIQSGLFPSQPPGGTYMMDVRDTVTGLLALVDKGRSGERYILGGVNLSFVDLNALTAHVIGKFPPPTILPEASKKPIYKLFQWHEALSKTPVSISADNLEAGFRKRYFSARKAQQELGWQSCIPLRQTLADTWHWYLDRGIF